MGQGKSGRHEFLVGLLVPVLREADGRKQSETGCISNVKSWQLTVYFECTMKAA